MDEAVIVRLLHCSFPPGNKDTTTRKNFAAFKEEDEDERWSREEESDSRDGVSENDKL